MITKSEECKAWRARNAQHVKDYDHSRKKARRQTETYKCERARYKRRQSDALRDFIAVDGEGWKGENGEDFFWLLAASTGERIQCPKPTISLTEDTPLIDAELTSMSVNKVSITSCVERENDGRTKMCAGPRLSTADCLDFLFSLKSKGKFLVGFGLNYDVQHILHDLTDEEFSKSRQGVWTTIGDWRYNIKRVPKKFLEVTRCPRSPWQPWYQERAKVKGERIRLFDSFTFFGTTFVSALQNWEIGTEEELAFIVRMKVLRGDFRSVPEDDIIRYNDLECRLFVDLMRELDRAAQDSLGVRLTWWHGPGALAKAVFKAHGIKEQVDTDQQQTKSRALVEAQYRAYFGGRFQVFSLGVHQEVYEYDICSAYPDQIRLLPHLGGRWRRTDRYEPGELAIYDVVWSIGATRNDNPHWPLSPFPWRDEHGSIHYPPGGRGTYYSVEVALAIAHWGDSRISVEGGWVYEPPEGGSPFSPWVEELYEERLRLGKGAKGLAIKLALNSGYGVMAQRRLSLQHTPIFRCPLWAGLITSGTRARLLSAALQKPSQVISFATDGVYLGSSLTVNIGKGLGDWEEEFYAEVGIWQPGIYYKQKSSGHRESRGRGIPGRLLDWNAVNQTWQETGVHGNVSVTIPETFVTRDLAIARGKPETAYHWKPAPRTLALHPGTGGFDWMEGSHRWNTWLPGVDYNTLSRPYAGMDFETTEEPGWQALQRIDEMDFQPSIEL